MDNSFLIRLGLDTQQLIAGVNKSNSILAGFQNQVTSLGRAIAGGLGFYTLSSAITGSVQKMATFQHSMSEVMAITGASGEEFQKLRNNALDLAGSFKAIDIARLETELGRLGFSTQEILQATKAIIELATATGEDLSKSAMIAGSTLRAFNLDASNMQRVVDVMASSFNKSALSLDNFGEAIKYVAPVAQAAGVSLEQTTAMLGVLADAGIKGSMAGTSLRKIISDLGQGAAPILAQKLKEMAVAGMSGSQAMDEVGRTAYAALLILANHTEKVDEATLAYQRAKGEAAGMSKIMQDDLIGDWNKLTAEFDKTIVKGTRLNDVLRDIVQGATALAKFLNHDAGQDLDRLLGAQSLWVDFVTGKMDDGYLKRIQQAAADAGIVIGYNWDQAGKKIESVFKLIKQEGPLGPFPAKRLEPPGVGSMTGKGGYDYESLFNDHKTAPKLDHSDITEFSKLMGTMDLQKISRDFKDLKVNVNGSSEGYKDFFGAVDQVNDALALEAEEIDPALTAETDRLIAAHNRLKTSMSSTAMSAQAMGRIMRTAYVDVLSGISKALGELATGGGIQSLEKTLLSTFGGIMTQLGEMAITVGVSLLKIKEALMTLNPYAAIGAGVALIALGTYFSAKSASIGSSIGGSSGGSGSSGVSTLGRGDTREQLVARVSGTDLLMVLQRQGAQDSFSKYPG